MPPNQTLLTVFEASKTLNVSPDTIRRWEKKGLIKAIRSDHNFRLFSKDELERVHNKVSGTFSGNNYKILASTNQTNYTSIELFAGAGGTALGLENAGFQHILLNEIDKDSVKTLKLNRHNWNVIHDDIKNVDFSEYYGKVDLVEGGFPCQSFSYAGKKRGFEDTRGTLFYEFARCIKETNPKIAMGENVKGLLNHDNGDTLKTMVAVLEDLGYRVQYKVLKAQYYDVPQKRERLVIIAIRKDLNIQFKFPEENDYIVSLKEAILDCPTSCGQQYSKYKKTILSLVPQGGYWKDLPIEVQKEYMKSSYFMGGGKTGMARRLSWDEPSLTLTCNPAQKQTERCHPAQTRPLNVREYARIQTFPDNWEFLGSVSSQYKQIGNAVPVNLAFHIGTSIINTLDQLTTTREKENYDFIQQPAFQF